MPVFVLSARICPEVRRASGFIVIKVCSVAGLTERQEVNVPHVVGWIGACIVQSVLSCCVTTLRSPCCDDV